MRLSWDVGYDDYADREHWLPRFEELKALEQCVTVEKAVEMEPSALLDSMEQIEELMRFYAATEDYNHLEPVMRKQYELLAHCRGRKIGGIGYEYLELEFIRIHAMLCRVHNQSAKAVEEYFQVFIQAQKVFERMTEDKTLTEDQIIYLGWSCVEGCKEASQANDAVLHTEESIKIMRVILPMLEWLKPHMKDLMGIREQTADLYCGFAGIFYTNRDPFTGAECFRESLQLYEEMVGKTDSDYYQAKYIWVMGLYGLQEYLMNGKAEIMLECEALAREYLRKREPIDRDRGIISGVQGLIALQKSGAFQQQGNLEEAIRLGESACSLLEESLDLLEHDYKESEGYYRAFVSEMAGRVFNGYVGVLDTVGVQYYCAERYEEAKKMLEKALDLLTNSPDYQMGESGAVAIRAECFEYLALIALDEGNPAQAEFYGKQGVDFADATATQIGNPAGWQIEIVCCGLLAELYLNQKAKEKAKAYAQRGLEACENLNRVLPQSPQLEMRAMLEKYYKKASRRFF